LTAVAWNDVWVQLVVITVLYAATHRHLFVKGMQAWRFYSAEIILVALCGSVFVLLKWSPLAISAGGSANIVASLCTRLLIVAMIWLIVGLSLYSYDRRTRWKKIVEPAT
jgi:hypothetical protein